MMRIAILMLMVFSMVDLTYGADDSDDDGVIDALDICQNTALVESVPTEHLGVNSFALIDGDGQFDTAKPKVIGTHKAYTIGDTCGCSCEQILLTYEGEKKGFWKFGCSSGLMDKFIAEQCGDKDGDGYNTSDGDCSDTDEFVHPEAEEICDRIDNNCNGVVDENC